MYVASFAGVVHGSLVAAPWHADSWPYMFVRRQRFMLDYGLHKNAAFPRLSPPWSWPLLKRPVLLYFEPGGRSYRTILAVGNPVTWALALASLVDGARRAARWVLGSRSGVTPAADLLAIGGFAVMWLPWFLLAMSRNFTFSYYLLPALPFLFLSAGIATERIVTSRPGRVAVGVSAAAAVAMAAFLAPLTYARPLSYDAWAHRMLFHDCAPVIADPYQHRVRPTREPGPPPPGWRRI